MRAMIELNTFGWITLFVCFIILAFSVVASVERLHIERGLHWAMGWLIINMAAISLPFTILALLALQQARP